MPFASDIAEALELQRLRGVVAFWQYGVQPGEQATARHRSHPWRLALDVGLPMELSSGEAWALVQGAAASWEVAHRQPRVTT